MVFCIRFNDVTLRNSPIRSLSPYLLTHTLRSVVFCPWSVKCWGSREAHALPDFMGRIKQIITIYRSLSILEFSINSVFRVHNGWENKLLRWPFISIIRYLLDIIDCFYLEEAFLCQLVKHLLQHIAYFLGCTVSSPILPPNALIVMIYFPSGKVAE